MSARPRPRTARAPLLIVATGAALPEVRRRFGDYAAWFRRGLRLPPQAIVRVRVDRGERLPAPASVAAVLITGSDAMVSDRLPWSERTAAWLRRAADAGVPMLGVCYGHQLLAHAFGGEVAYNPRGLEIGTIAVVCTPAARRDALFAHLPREFFAQATHAQTVVRAPRGAVVLARSAQDRHQALRFAPRVWGVQFHPEFGVRPMRALIRADAAALARAGRDVGALSRDVRACAEARSVLRRFAELVAR
jgi:GMP synthase (glutamine-hydrolysing)